MPLRDSGGLWPSAPAGTLDSCISDDEFSAWMGPLGPFARLVAVGCSGGPDSLALTRLAERWARGRGIAVIALIVEHGLRAESADEARALGQALARKGIAHRILPLNLPPGPRLQERARTARRAALLAACLAAGAPHLLLGHHAEDQAETIVFRALRGSAAPGLGGMAPLIEAPEALILRPLLGAPQARLRASLQGWGIAPIEDPSNRDPRFARARLRAATGKGGGVPLDPAPFARRRARMAQEVAARMAAAVRLLPEGCAEISPEALGRDATARRVMAALVRAVGGGAHAPGAPAVARLLAAGCGTLGGARWLKGGRWLVREAATRNMEFGLWDGRFRAATLPEEYEIGPLGADSARFRGTARHLPAATLAALPALRRLGDGKLALVPHLFYDAAGPCLPFPLHFAPRGGAVTESHHLG